MLLPGLYIVEANALHGISSAYKGPWTDSAELAYRMLVNRGLHDRRAASPLRFARLCATLRKLKPIHIAGHALLIWRLGPDELRLASDGEPAEVFPASALSPAVRKLQDRFLGRIMDAVGAEARASSETCEPNGYLDGKQTCTTDTTEITTPAESERRR